MHLPERALVGGGLRRLGGELGVRVDVGQRQVPPDVADVAEVAEELADDRLGLPAVRALEVAVLDERDRRVDRARGCGRAPGRRRRRGRRAAPPCRAAPGRRVRRGSSAVARNSSQVRSAAPSAALRMPSFASSSCAPVEGERRDQQRDGEADPGDRAAAGDAPPSRRAGAAGRGSAASAARTPPRMPTGLPTT